MLISGLALWLMASWAAVKCKNYNNFARISLKLLKRMPVKVIMYLLNLTKFEVGLLLYKISRSASDCAIPTILSQDLLSYCWWRLGYYWELPCLFSFCHHFSSGSDWGLDKDFCCTMHIFLQIFFLSSNLMHVRLTVILFALCPYGFSIVASSLLASL